MPQPQQRILIVSGQHFIDSARKVSLHFTAEEFVKKGFAVDFLSIRLSPLSRLIKDERLASVEGRVLNRWVRVKDTLEELIWYSPFHPFASSNPFLNTLSKALFALYPALLPRSVLNRVPDYDFIMLESGLPVILFERLKKAGGKARFLYHGADRLETIGVHPFLIDVMNRTAPRYDLIRVVAASMRNDFPEDARVVHIPHGISKQVFDNCGPSPYEQEKNIISVGDMLFDEALIHRLAQRYNDFTFHLFGRKAKVSTPADNIICHGECPFEKLAPFIKHADLGLATYQNRPGADYLSQSSLKMIQYSYCGLPIVAPDFAKGERRNVFAYDANDEASLMAALDQAIAARGRVVMNETFYTWSEVVDQLIHNAIN
jgi:2-beta-glucuronyltransferase